MTYALHINARSRFGATRQSHAIPGRESEMVANRAGGVVFAVDCWTRLQRFLILGSDAPTYYADSATLTVDNAEGVLQALREDGLRVVREIVRVSQNNLAPKNDHALFALAMAVSYGVRGVAGTDVATGTVAERLVKSGDLMAVDVRRAAFEVLPKVARTATHGFMFCENMESLRGWGRQAVRALQGWFASFDDERLALQAVKYRQRNGWSLRDLLRLCSPSIVGEDRRALVDWIVHRGLDADQMQAHETLVSRSSGGRVDGVRPVTPRRHAVRPVAEIVADARSRFRLIEGFHRVQEAVSAEEAARVIRSHSVPFECVPTQFLGDRIVWDALLADMPMTNMIRNLGKMSSVGLLTVGSDAARFVAGRLQDAEAIQRERVHPYRMLLALKTYARGSGFLGDLTWKPAPMVTDALDSGFYLAFRAVRSSGRRFMLGLDVSGSMKTNFIWSGQKDRRGMKIPGPISARVASAAMAMVTSATEPSCHVVGFTGPGAAGYWTPGGSAYNFCGHRSGVMPLDLSPRRRLDDVCRSIDGLPFGGTDAALPVLYALENGIMVDVFVIYTDNETWSGGIHVSEAIRRYRDKTGIPARLVAVGMTAEKYSIADPQDGGMMDVVGFDASAPAVIADFAKGE